MPQYTQEYRQKIYEGFETTRLLSAVDHVDQLRQLLGDDEDFRPPQIRQDLLRLHQLAMEFVNNGAMSKGPELFDLAFDLDDQIFTIREALDEVEKTIQTLTDLAPDPDEDYENGED
ncbi:transposase [Leptolyngbyaceae cyanobacterium CCMR0082]|uniref:Transposase n=1 Tax=Adonisia turfae CCMR0082 TaxID=2304604 RepID=A0A6M0SIK7_9CYAN|nr:transposase [Adonisia turfae]NEZ68337.1 transposase [Adonisia turfae CCMR0082]